jgi:hypothetical protein
VDDEKGLKGESLIARPGGEQMARRRMVRKMTRQEKGPTLVKRRKAEGSGIQCAPLIRAL